MLQIPPPVYPVVFQKKLIEISASRREKQEFALLILLLRAVLFFAAKIIPARTLGDYCSAHFIQ